MMKECLEMQHWTLYTFNERREGGRGQRGGRDARRERGGRMRGGERERKRESESESESEREWEWEWGRESKLKEGGGRSHECVSTPCVCLYVARKDDPLVYNCCQGSVTNQESSERKCNVLIFILQAVKFPKSAYRYLQLLIGQKFESPLVQKYQEWFPFYELKKDEERGVVINICLVLKLEEVDSPCSMQQQIYGPRPQHLSCLVL